LRGVGIAKDSQRDIIGWIMVFVLEEIPLHISLASSTPHPLHSTVKGSAYPEILIHTDIAKALQDAVDFAALGQTGGAGLYAQMDGARG
jgi:hypothetical protein